MNPGPVMPEEPAAVDRLDRVVLEIHVGRIQSGGRSQAPRPCADKPGAPEGTIFYKCPRFGSSHRRRAQELAGLPASAVVLSNLIVLEQFALIPTTTRYWAHALRRLGNTVRHLHRRVTSNDANVVLEFTERMLQWFSAAWTTGGAVSIHC